MNTTNRNINNPSYLWFLGGFVEGEGSNSVSVTIHKNFKFGINILAQAHCFQCKST